MSDDLQLADQLVPAAPAPRVLTTLAFHQLADVPPALTWFANIDNPQTRRAYPASSQHSSGFLGITNVYGFSSEAIESSYQLPRRRQLRSTTCAKEIERAGLIGM